MEEESKQQLALACHTSLESLQHHDSLFWARIIFRRVSRRQPKVTSLLVDQHLAQAENARSRKWLSVSLPEEGKSQVKSSRMSARARCSTMHSRCVSTLTSTSRKVLASKHGTENCWRRNTSMQSRAHVAIYILSGIPFDCFVFILSKEAFPSFFFILCSCDVGHLHVLEVHVHVRFCQYHTRL